jgi:hypothetical protein
MFLWI